MVGKWVGSLGKKVNSGLEREREREKRNKKGNPVFDIWQQLVRILCKKWSAKIKTRVTDLADENESARADFPFCSGGPK